MGSIIKRPFKTYNGTDWDTHFFETEADLVRNLAKQTETNVRLDNPPDGTDGAREGIIEIGNKIGLIYSYCEIMAASSSTRSREVALNPIIANRISCALGGLNASCWQKDTWGVVAGRYSVAAQKFIIAADGLSANKACYVSMLMLVKLK